MGLHVWVYRLSEALLMLLVAGASGEKGIRTMNEACGAMLRAPVCQTKNPPDFVRRVCDLKKRAYGAASTSMNWRGVPGTIGFV
jgi:hypothetical protein